MTIHHAHLLKIFIALEMAKWPAIVYVLIYIILIRPLQNAHHKNLVALLVIIRAVVELI